MPGNSLRSFFKCSLDHLAETRLGLLYLPIHVRSLVRPDRNSEMLFAHSQTSIETATEGIRFVQKPASSKFLDGLVDPPPLPYCRINEDLDYYVVRARLVVFTYRRYYLYVWRSISGMKPSTN
jgi:hypothetical protein